MTDKDFQTLRARAALVGIAIERIKDDHELPAFVLTSGAVTVTLRTREGIEAWLSTAAPVAETEGTNAL